MKYDDLFLAILFQNRTIRLPIYQTIGPYGLTIRPVKFSGNCTEEVQSSAGRKSVSTTWHCPLLPLHIVPLSKSVSSELIGSNYQHHVRKGFTQAKCKYAIKKMDSGLTGGTTIMENAQYVRKVTEAEET